VPDVASSILAIIFIVKISFEIVNLEAMPLDKNTVGLKTLITGVSINVVYDLLKLVVPTSG